MIIKTLIENKSCRSDVKSEHGLCLYIEHKERKILFDLGSSDLYLKNAKVMGIDIGEVDSVILSHGHLDHGGGLKAFLNHNQKAKIYIHEAAFGKFYSGLLGLKIYIGLDQDLRHNERIIFTKDRLEIGDGLQLFSDVKAQLLPPYMNKKLLKKTDTGYEKDDFIHEQNLLINDGEKTHLFAGCAHRGILNITNKAEEILGHELDQVIGGFHLMNPILKKTEPVERISELASHLMKKKTQFFTCHCTGQKAYDHLSIVMGSQIDYLKAGQII